MIRPHPCTRSGHLHCLLAAVLALLMASCAIGPEYTAPPAIELGNDWVADGILHDQAQPDRWWEASGDATLIKLIEQGLAHNLDVRLAVSGIEEARARLGLAERADAPVIGGHAGDTIRRQSKNGVLPIGKIPGINRDQTIYDTGIEASWEFDVFDRVRHGVESAQARVQASEADAAAIRFAIASEIARSYTTLRGKQQQRDELEAIITAVTQVWQLTRQRVSAGDLPPNAEEQVRVQLDSLQAKLTLLEADGRAAALALGILLGGLPEQGQGIAAQQGDMMQLPDVPVGQRADLLRRRPDIVAAERRLAASTAGVALAMAEQFPKLSIAASGGFQSLSAATWLDGASQMAAFSPLISWRIFDGGRIKAEIHASEARQRSAAIAYEKTVLTAISEAEQALHRYHFARVALRQQQQAVAGADAILRHQQQRFEAGDISQLELLEARQQFHQQAELEVQLRLAATLALIRSYRTLGGGWQVAGRSAP